jgi:hypothetical protein
VITVAEAEEAGRQMTGVLSQLRGLRFSREAIASADAEGVDLPELLADAKESALDARSKFRALATALALEV